MLFHTVRIRAGDKIDSKIFSFYKSHHFSEAANWLLFIKGSKFVLFVDIYPWSWVVKHSHISNWRRYGGHLCPSFSIQRYVYCNILQSRIVCIKEVFLAGGCFLNGQWTSFTSEESRPRGNSSVSKCWTGLCSVLWWSWFELWTCTPVPCLHWNRLQVSFKSGFNAICSAIQGPGLAPGNASPRLCYNSIVI